VHELGPVGIGIAIGIAASQPLFIAATQWLAMMSVKTGGRMGTGRAQGMQWGIKRGDKPQKNCRNYGF
jgi:hypothetical protein